MYEDPLSDLLKSVHLQLDETAELRAGGDWALSVQNVYSGVKFGAVLMGSCLLQTADQPGPVRLNKGDCYLMNASHPYWLGSDCSLPGTAAHLVFSGVPHEKAFIGQGCDTLLFGGRFTFAEPQGHLFTSSLPHFIHVPSDTAEAVALSWTLQQIAQETTKVGSGKSFLIQLLGQMLFIYVLRQYMKAPRTGPNWLAAFSDPRLSKALQMIHSAPATHWTLETLAKAAGMSKTSFCRHFKAQIAMSPLEYAVKWRLQLAAYQLRHSNHKVSQIAYNSGYSSESAFSVAFKRLFGISPRFYRNDTKYASQT